MKNTMCKESNKQKNKLEYQELLSKNKLLSDFMNQIPDVIYFKDTKGRLILVNQAHAKGLGLKPDEVIGKTDFDIFSKERAAEMAKDDAYVIKTGSPIIDKIERATRADGEDNYVSTTKIPRYDHKGNIVGLMGITRDITQRMQFNNLKEEKERIEKKLEALKEIDKLKSEFVAVVSHELRTPLTIIKEAIMLMSDKIAGPINNKQEDLLIKTKGNIEKLRRIIENLLDIARIEKGTLRLYYSLINLNDLISDSSEYFKKSAAEKDVYLTYQLPKEQINIFIDSQKINQVISNLINNAIKFTEKNGEVKVEAKILEDKIRIGIIDTGIGIAKHDLPDIFKKFVQVSKIADTQRKGLGLGLSIARELIEKHGGEIWVESKLGVGSSFYFTIPKFYTTKALDKNLKERINKLLEKNITAYLINLSIINFKEFKNRLKLAPKKLFEDLNTIIEIIFQKLPLAERNKPQMILKDYRNGVYSFIYPDTTENKTSRLCESLKNKIKDYLIKTGIKNVFINVGVLSYPTEEKISTTQQLSANLYVKKIYLGAEIRRFARINYEADIEILLPDKGSESSQTIDISEGGICFMSATPLKTDAKINIKLELFPKESHFYTQGRVVWIKTIETSKEAAKKFKIGVEFACVKKQDKRRLSKLINSILS